MERLHVVPRVGGVLLYVRPTALVVGRILTPHTPSKPSSGTSLHDLDNETRTHLGRDDNLVPNPARLHPLPNELLRAPVLVVVRGVDEVPARVVERVQQLEARRLVHHAHTVLTPLVADAHASEADRRDVNPRLVAEAAVATELGRGRAGGSPELEERHEDDWVGDGRDRWFVGCPRWKRGR